MYLPYINAISIIIWGTTRTCTPAYNAVSFTTLCPVLVLDLIGDLAIYLGEYMNHVQAV